MAIDDLASRLGELIERADSRAAEDPFGNPVLSVALALARQMDAGELDEAAVTALVAQLRDAAFRDRAARLAAYVGGTATTASEQALATVARTMVRPDPADSPIPWARFRAEVERTRYAAVFTAHPTFSLPRAVADNLAAIACGTTPARLASHRPERPTLAQEFAWATAAISHGRDALDRLNAALLACAGAHWPDRWTALLPRPLVLSSWVGYDTDGRTDIGWWDTLRLRLEMKRLQLERLHRQLAPVPVAEPLAAMVAGAIDAVQAQIAARPDAPDPARLSVFAHALVDRRDTAMTSPEPLLAPFAQAIAAADERSRLALCVARAGLVAHGLSLAHTHVRLNSAQLHNVVRQRLGITDPPEDPAHRRALLAKINVALDAVAPVPVDFGALFGEQASAARRAARGDRYARSGHLARPRRAHPAHRAARGAGGGGARAGAAGLMERDADDVPPRAGGPSGAAGGVAGRAAHGHAGKVLHALRLALIQRIWLLATEIPEFSPRHGVTHAVLVAAILRLEIPAALAALAEIFPEAPTWAGDWDYAEPHAPRGPQGYAREHSAIFAPMARLFDLVREIAAAITHEVGAFG
jgi:hypothetical protein